MFKSLVLLLFSGICCQMTAQNAISGYIPFENLSNGDVKVYLSRLKIEDFPDRNAAEPIAESDIDKNGYFSFKKQIITDKNAIYRVYVKRIATLLKDTLQTDHLFLLSNTDSIRFQKGDQLFSRYTNSNPADKEWQKLRNYEASLFGVGIGSDQHLSDAYLQDMRNYSKDSLQILLVKLIGIKQLDNRDLLGKDIAKNPDYYLNLLKELKESELDRSEYLFLENKLAFLTTEVAENKFRKSEALNILLGIVLAGLLILVIRYEKRKRKPALVPLSKQETNIRDLILQGKSNKEIANELYISLNTVKTHITNIYYKLQVSNRQELLQRIQN